jgi:hypothetical protein
MDHGHASVEHHHHSGGCCNSESNTNYDHSLDHGHGSIEHSHTDDCSHSHSNSINNYSGSFDHDHASINHDHSESDHNHASIDHDHSECCDHSHASIDHDHSDGCCDHSHASIDHDHKEYMPLTFEEAKILKPNAPTTCTVCDPNSTIPHTGKVTRLRVSNLCCSGEEQIIRSVLEPMKGVMRYIIVFFSNIYHSYFDILK